jgi:hypothetical protein
VAALRIELTKRTDGGAALRCVRADGSVTWQRHRGRQAAFFPVHDLAHLAVESVLGATSGFYGLVAAGWDIEDTTGKGSRGAIPAEAMRIERLVGLLDLERAGAARWTADELNAQLGGEPMIDDENLERVRTRTAELITRWSSLPPGETLVLPFES